jgi:2-polyprenyl-3-methyl-5-hydroxy-6-metoxy-1,4-benzoquinol methylase
VGSRKLGQTWMCDHLTTRGAMDISGYRYSSTEAEHTKGYLWAAVFAALENAVRYGLSRRVFELGCGNGALAREISARGFQVVGVDPSREGIALAQGSGLGLQIEAGSSEEDLAARFGVFPFVISLEVVEHVEAPRQFAKRVFDLLEPGGIAIISTPYHGYLKNLALALSGKLDEHFTALWDHGHIKFWSIETLGKLLRDTGFKDVSFKRVGRIPPLAKSMIALAHK